MKRREFVRATAAASVLATVPSAVLSAVSAPKVHTITITLNDMGDTVSVNWVRDHLIPAINEVVGDDLHIRLSDGP